MNIAVIFHHYNITHVCLFEPERDSCRLEAVTEQSGQQKGNNLFIEDKILFL